MWKTWIVAVCPFAVVLAAMTYGQAEPTRLLVEVTSSIPGQELQFAAAYVFQDEESQLETMETATPIEFERVAPSFAGIFRQGSSSVDGAVLEVRLFRRIRGEWREVAMADGTTIVLNEFAGQRTVFGW